MLTYSSNQYNISIRNNFLVSNGYFVLCARERNIVNATNTECNVEGYTNSYSCFDVTPTISGSSVTAVAVTSFTEDLTLTSVNTTTTAVANVAEIGSNSVAVTMSTAISLTANRIYEAVVGTRKDLANGENTKQAFFHTFRANGQTSVPSTNLFMQRHVECSLHFHAPNYVYSLIFYGGVVRNGGDTMFIHFVSYLGNDTAPNTTASLNMWAGLSYSTSHASKDMMAVSSLSSDIDDMYSLYYTAPYLDTANEINGTSNFFSKVSSYDEAVGLTFFLHAGGSRLYDTGDTTADEIIRKKINSRFCYAEAYSDGTSAIKANERAYNHAYVMCWKPNIAIWQPHLTATLMTLFLLLILTQ